MSENAEALARLYVAWLGVLGQRRKSYISSDECAQAFGRWADALGVQAPDLKEAA